MLCPNWGFRYQGHNPRPGPVYSGGGYTPMSQAIASFRAERAGGAEEAATALGQLLGAHPDLVNDVSTGGALPLHTCGMSRENQHATTFLISRGADVEALDTYGYTPLHRMASNNLDVGAASLLAAGADPTHGDGDTPAQIAAHSAAGKVAAVLKKHGSKRTPSTDVSAIAVFSSGAPAVAGRYTQRASDDVPAGFAAVCVKNGWDVATTWGRLNGAGNRWFAHEETENESYIYFNQMDRMWWIDGPDGLGVFTATAPSWSPPGGSIRWNALDGKTATPTLAVFREGTAAAGECGTL